MPKKISKKPKKGSITKQQVQSKKGMKQSQTVNVYVSKRSSGRKSTAPRPAIKPPQTIIIQQPSTIPQTNTPFPIPPTNPTIQTPVIAPAPISANQRVTFEIPRTQPSKEYIPNVRPVFQTEEPEYFLLPKTSKPEKESRPIPTRSSYWLSLPYSQDEDRTLLNNQQYEAEGIKRPTKTRDMDKIPVESKNIPTRASFETPFTFEYTPVPDVAGTIPSYVAPQIPSQSSKKQIGNKIKSPEIMQTTPTIIPFEEEIVNGPPIENRRIITGIFESPNIYTEPTYPSIFTTQVNESVDEVLSSKTTASRPLQGEQRPIKSIGKITSTPSKMKPLPDYPVSNEVPTNINTEESTIPQTTPLPEELKFIGSGTPDLFEPSTITSPEIELSDFPVGLTPLQPSSKRPPASRKLELPETPVSIQTPESFIQTPAFRKEYSGVPASSKQKNKATTTVVYIPIENEEPQISQPTPSKPIIPNPKRLKSPVITEDEKLPVSRPTIPIANIGVEQIVAGELKSSRGRGRPIKVIENPTEKEWKRLEKAQKERERYQKKVEQKASMTPAELIQLHETKKAKPQKEKQRAKDREQKEKQLENFYESPFGESEV